MIHERVLALAGLMQALREVRRIAETGQAEAAVVATAIDSVLRVDADSPQSVYGSSEAVRPGLHLLKEYLSNQNKDEALPRLGLAVLQLERRFVRNQLMVARVQEGIAAASITSAQLGSSHPEVLALLGALYADTISQLRPKVMVQGNPHYLAQADVVSEIRALLLAAVRSAVLWRQLGGSLFDFLLQRRNMLAAIDSELG
ncbi:MAG: high frequency lysogenization protein HflD [Luteimonas sp.]